MISTLQTAASSLLLPLHHPPWRPLQSLPLLKTLFRMGIAQGPQMQGLDMTSLRMSRTTRVSSSNFTSSTMFVPPP